VNVVWDEILYTGGFSDDARDLIWVATVSIALVSPFIGLWILFVMTKIRLRECSQQIEQSVRLESRFLEFLCTRTRIRVEEHEGKDPPCNGNLPELRLPYLLDAYAWPRQNEWTLGGVMFAIMQADMDNDIYFQEPRTILKYLVVGCLCVPMEGVEKAILVMTCLAIHLQQASSAASSSRGIGGPKSAHAMRVFCHLDAEPQLVG